MSLAIEVLEPSALLIVCQVLDGALLTRLRGVKPGIGGAANVRFCLQANIRILCLAEQLKSVGPMLKGCGVTSKLLKILLRQKGGMTQEL